MDKRTEIRCNDNPFHTLLFRYDWRGIWVYCRDCRREDGGRGAEHLINWPRVLRMMLGLEKVNDDQHCQRASCNNNDPEG